MNKELRGIVIEIITLILVLIIVVPVCVSASNKYQKQKEVLLTGINTSVDISSKDDGKLITVYSNHNEKVKINLILKIYKFSNEYGIWFDEEYFNLREIESKEDSNYRYYNLGIYEVDKVREFNFKLEPIETTYYDETISYSFITDGGLWRK